MSSFVTSVGGAETVKEVAKAAGLNFVVGESPLAYRASVFGSDEIGRVLVSKRSKILYREDTGAELAVVGSGYKVHQVSEILGFMDKLKGEIPELKYSKAGALNGGRQFFFQAELGESMPVPGDIHKRVLMVHSGFGGGVSTKGFPTGERVFCWNQMCMTLEGAEKLGFKVSHTQFSKQRLRTLIGLIGAIETFYQKDESFNRELSHRQARTDVVTAFLKALIPDPDKGSKARAESARELIEGLFQKGKGADLPVDSKTRVGDTLYGLRNAVTEYTNHHRATRGNGGRSAAERRFESTIFGSSAKLIKSADELLVTILEKDLVPEIERNTVDAVDLMAGL